MKPTGFISSTIYDFEDLRDALRFWLEERGFKVQLSETPAFERNADSNSYDACLEAVRKADVFILLMGDRRGGWYDQEKRISITQREYQVAYEESLKSNLKILPFVRKSTWELNAYYKEIRKKLENVEKAKEALKQENGRIQDPEHLSSFLQEVGRVEEMKKAAAGNSSELPKGNWITTFSGFRDIVENLEVVLKLSTDIPTRHLLHLASSELQKVMAKYVRFPKENAPYLNTNYLDSDLPNLDLSPEELLDQRKKVRLTERQIGVFVTFALTNITSRLIGTFPALEKLYLTDSLAKIDPTTNKYKKTELQQAVQRTYQAISSLCDRESSKNAEEICKEFLVEAQGSRDHPTFPIHARVVTLITASYLHAKSALNETLNLVGHIELGTPLIPDPTKGISTPAKKEGGRAVEFPTTSSCDSRLNARPPSISKSSSLPERRCSKPDDSGSISSSVLLRAVSTSLTSMIAR